MIHNTYLFSMSGIGDIISSNPLNKDDITDDGLICSFLAAIRLFSHEFFEELASINFVKCKITLLPSQDIYVLAVKSSFKYSRKQLVHYLEIIRDHINSNHWDEIHDEKFFTDVGGLKNYLNSIVKEVIEKEEWMECK